MHRLQILLREWGSAGEQNLSGRTASSHRIPADTPLLLAYGVVEVVAGSIADETMLPVRIDRHKGRAFFGHPLPETGDRWDREEAAVGEITDWLTREVWRAPSAPLPKGTIYGQVVARRCALEAGPGLEALILCGIVSRARGLDERVPPVLLEGIGSLAGSFGLRRGRSAVIPPLGSAGSQVFKIPNWGWGEEQVAFRSTMTLDMQDAADRIHALQRSSSPTPKETAELKELQYKTGGLGQSGLQDRMYGRYLNIFHQVSPERPPTRKPVTQAEMSMSDRIARTIIQATMDEENDDVALVLAQQRLMEAGLIPADAQPKP